ncbi:class I SAM-dependent methyltransferase [uncultured Arcticibacterium sp.]|uniref:class I SAM-dependent methyltransferase n=1 Tax=uncultured Arcticibacterium sp. TaxID=2173042 RepID=UPI0030F7119A
MISRLSQSQKRKLANILACFFSNSLRNLANIYNPSKGKCYDFFTLYTKHLKKFKYKRFNLLEIGIGGYESPTSGGGSLRVWKKYFRFGRIFGIDINDKSPHEERRITTFKGSQSNTTFLSDVMNKIGAVDVIIDDGSHRSDDVITSFEFLFPFLSSGGVYVIEDTQTSYWNVCGGSMHKDAKTTMNFFKNLADGLNHEEFPSPGYIASYFDLNIIAIHFYHNIIFIEKGENNKGSNVLKNNTLPSA